MKYSYLLSPALVGCLAFLASPAMSAPITQDFTLEPGWNAIYLEVEPTDNAPSAVFSDEAIEQVWTYFPGDATVGYIGSPTETWNEGIGRRYIPAARPESVVTDLFAIFGSQAYLVKVSGAAPVNLSVTGEPAQKANKWQGQSFNFSGLRLDPDDAISLGDYFAPSDAHQPLEIYQLDSGGAWELALPQTIAEPGRSYWIRASAGSDYPAPLQVVSGSPDGIQFNTSSNGDEVILRNLTDAPMDVTIANEDALTLVREVFDPVEGRTFPPLTTLNLMLEAGEERRLVIHFREADVAGNESGNLVVSGGGSRYRIPVSIVVDAPVEAATLVEARSLQAFVSKDASAEDVNESDRTGLWIGRVLVDRVSFVHAGERKFVEGGEPVPNVNDGDASLRETPVPTQREFPLRAIIHVDGNGNATLLGQVIIMRAQDSEDFVVISEDDQIQFHRPARQVNGRDFSFRTSALGFDTVDGVGIPLNGSFRAGLVGEITIGEEDLVNPNVHQFHPDHDGRDALGNPQPSGLNPIEDETWAITRQVTFTEAAPSDDLNERPETGGNRLVGTYTETVTGMHKRPIQTEGTFLLERVLTNATLNP